MASGDRAPRRRMCDTRPNIFTWLALVVVMVGPIAGFFVGLSGCRPAKPEVIVYAALDRTFSEPILEDFERQTGIRVRVKYDTESTKSVGLTSQIIAESRGRTRCDVFWNNEILNTLRLDGLDLLAPVRPAARDEFPDEFRSPQDHWHGFAARARVLIVNTELVAEEQTPDSIFSLLDPHWKGRIGMAKPLFGTTATHSVCLFVALGEERARQFFQDLKANDVQILGGNKQVAEDVAHGRLAFGLTDTDDAIIELESGFPVRIVYPDALPSQLGTLFIPNTVCQLRGAPHPESAKKLIDYLVTPEVERRLAAGASAQIPLSKSARTAIGETLRVETPERVPGMRVDFASCADRWDEVGRFLRRQIMEN